MKKYIMTSALAIACGMFVTGCASPFPTGVWYTNLKLPVGATSNSVATKVGYAESKSYLGLIAVGDSSIDTAKRNGGIRTVSHVDWEAHNILGIIGTYKVTVYGD